jgi:hypothetical protein
MMPKRGVEAMLLLWPVADADLVSWDAKERMEPPGIAAGLAIIITRLAKKDKFGAGIISGFKKLI